MADMASFKSYTTPSGFLLPSLHAAPFFFSQQVSPEYADDHNRLWIRLFLTYARHRRLFTLKVEDAEATGSEWDEVLRNERIKRQMRPPFLQELLAIMVKDGQAAYEPPKQTRSVLLYWRRPEEWAEVLHAWASSTGQINTILTFYEITDPPVPSDLSDLPAPLLRSAIAILAKTGRAQTITISDGDGVRFFERRA